MCKCSNHCLHHLLPSERDTGHDLRHRGHSYQLVCYILLGVASLFVCCMIHCKHLCQMQINLFTYLLELRKFKIQSHLLSLYTQQCLIHSDVTIG